jgi:hypothetical protein
MKTWRMHLETRPVQTVPLCHYSPSLRRYRMGNAYVNIDPDMRNNVCSSNMNPMGTINTKHGLKQTEVSIRDVKYAECKGAELQLIISCSNIAQCLVLHSQKLWCSAPEDRSWRSDAPGSICVSPKRVPFVYLAYQIQHVQQTDGGYADRLDPSSQMTYVHNSTSLRHFTNQMNTQASPSWLLPVIRINLRTVT